MNISLICPTRFLTLSPARRFPENPIFAKKGRLPGVLFCLVGAVDVQRIAQHLADCGDLPPHSDGIARAHLHDPVRLLRTLDVALHAVEQVVIAVGRCLHADVLASFVY